MRYDKEKLLIGIIVMILGAVVSYRIAFVDKQLEKIEVRVDKISECKPR